MFDGLKKSVILLDIQCVIVSYSIIATNLYNTSQIKFHWSKIIREVHENLVTWKNQVYGSYVYGSYNTKKLDIHVAIGA